MAARQTPVKSSKKDAVSSGSKMKQSSLLSFFKKSSPVKESTPPNGESSPTRGKGDALTDSFTSPEASFSDLFKENNDPEVKLVPLARSESRTPLLDVKSNIPSSPTRDEPVQDDEDDTPVVLSSSRRGTVRKNVSYAESDEEEDEDEDGAPIKTKRRRIDIDDPEDDDFVVPDHESEPEDDLIDDVVPDDDGEPVEADENDDDDDIVDFKLKKTPSKKSKDISNSSFNLSERFGTTSTTSTPSRPSVSKKTSSSSSTPVKKNFTKLNEERYQWLVTVKDAEGRLESDPDYDPRTLFIPSSAWSKFTSFEKQYWDIKSKMWDCIVFFKKGKFYELYEKDADLAHNLFDLKLAGGGRANMRLAGVPEMSFDYWASSFIAKGYKVAKVDQKESMLAKSIRDKSNKNGKKDAVVHRELEAVLTVGTLTDENMLTDDMSTYCLALKESLKEDGTKVFGISFVDTATGAVKLLEFEDDSECTKLETALAQIRPKEIIVERNHIAPLTLKLLKLNSAQGSLWNYLKSGEEFWDSDTTFENLTRLKFFPAENLDDLSKYPKALVEFHENHLTGFSAFGALFYYLRSLKLDKSIISMGKINKYDFIRSSSSLVLDGITLQNLEIFGNSFDGSDKGTLFKILNKGITPFGKRLFRSWVIHPLYDREMIEARLDSVELLLNDGDLRYLVESKLSKLPDLERLLSRVHSGYLKIKDFVRVIEGFEEIASLIKIMKTNYGETYEKLGGSLRKILAKLPPKLQSCVDKWSDAFDRMDAIHNGTLTPQRGIEPEFDESKDKVTGLESKLNDLLKQYRREYKCQEMCFRDSGKEIFLVECPKSIEKKLPSNWIQMGATNKLKRYWPPAVKTIVDDLMEARELHKILTEQLQTRLYAKFDLDSKTWSKAVNCVAGIDCLMALAKASESLGLPSCRPEFVDNDGRAMVEFKELRNPCFIQGGVSGTKDFIPNDIKLGGAFEDPNLALLTGANAAGKSTVLRMTCVAVIMAQIGCFVPCESAKLTPIDRIMTRLGANDNIMQGKSTFYVELSETKRMLETATPRSLIVMDELGRGGSSSDGFAIAEAVLHHMATHVQSIGFFATHYSTLGLSFKTHPQVKSQRMAIICDSASRNITFLYKLEDGTSPGSFGMHVASMCGIEESIVDNAELAAKTYEHTSKLKNSEVNKFENEKLLIPLGLQSDFSWLLKNDEKLQEGIADYDKTVALKNILAMANGFS